MSASDAIPSDLRARLGDRYAIDRPLGRGGMGAVYLARDVRLDRLVALKVLPAEFTNQVDLRERFLRETRTAASFSHPNIVPVFSIEEHDDLLAFAMGYVEGESVAELVKRAGPLSVRETVRLLQDVGYALAYAHGRGVVHRDIKPDNIMIERATGRAMVMDFGISRTISTTTTNAGLTRVGEVVGTPEFMSPEQASADNIDGRSDLYSLGLVAWFALTGRFAITGETTQKVLVKQLTETIPPIAGERGDLPQALSDVVDRCVRKDPVERFTTAEELVEALDIAQLRGVDVPLPVRLLSDDLRQASLILLISLAVGPLLFYFLRHTERFDLDYLLPMVTFGALVWARLTQSLKHVERLAERGFGSSAMITGFSRIAAEREADRAQLRADPVEVRRRRRDLIGWALLLAGSYGIIEFVGAFMRTLVAPEIHQVSRAGVWLLYVAYVLRGLSIVGILRSPLRRPPGEWLFRLFWMGPLGRAILRFAARKVRMIDGGRTTGIPVATVPALVAPALKQAKPDAGGTLEARVRALETWRDSVRDRPQS